MVWTTAYQNKLPDSAFLLIRAGGQKDASGKTVPRSLRMFPVKDDAGKFDLEHLRNALSRIPQARLDSATKQALFAKCRSMLARAHRQAGALAQSALRDMALCESSRTPLPAVDEDGVMRGVTLIQAGFNATGRTLFTPEFLQEAVLPKTMSALMYRDHPTASEQRERPERSAKETAAVVTNPRWDAGAQAILGDLEFLSNEAGRDIRETLSHEAIRRQFGPSVIVAEGGVSAKRMQVEGKWVDVPVAIHPAFPVGFDMVTAPTAS